MPRKKKTASKTAAPKINKSAWIREQPVALAAKDVVEKAAKAGIKVSVAQVYTTRSEAKKIKGKPGRPNVSSKAAPKPAVKGTSDELMFKRLVLSIGLPKAEAYLSDLKRSVGL